MENRRVLVIEDDEDCRDLMEMALVGAGYKVLCSSTGLLEIETVLEFRPDLIVLDVKLPNTSGYEVCRLVKTKDILRRVPVIFVSSLTDIRRKIAAFDVGATDYVVKPFDIDEFLARTRAHIFSSDLQADCKSVAGLTDQPWVMPSDGTGEYGEQGDNGPQVSPLTQRERECLTWLSRGMLYDRIAEMMKISTRTVEFHLANARKKLNAKTREQTLVMAIKEGMIDI